MVPTRGGNIQTFFAPAARGTALALPCALLAACLLLAGCERSYFNKANMRDGARLKPYQSTPFFADGMATRPPVPGTVARGQLFEDALLHQGAEADGEHAREIPLPVTLADLRRGQERFNITCANCHGADGYGDGMIVRRGYSRPPSFHTNDLRAVPPGHIFEVITHGFGRMPPHAALVAPEDRWRIVMYVRALQLSQRGSLEDVPEQHRRELEGQAR